ncbi:MAG: hypothetical protein KAJ19_28945 [Gammaproteobacteria bacterium]|nr:hypothetical protein [Gammaproteobacteria bacterium]
MTTQTKTGGYLKRMANGGHFKQKLGETALALTECFCKADNVSQNRLGDLMVMEVRAILMDVYGWEAESTHHAIKKLGKAFRNTSEGS